jgi:DNA-binding transcriptional MerR regulator
MTSRPDGFVKMSVLAKMSGVPAATIKHYVHAGLLPEPARTSRNMAYYSVGLVPRIQRIKHLQRTRFLPLRVIKRMLDERELDADETIAVTIARVLERDKGSEARSREELERSGLDPRELDFLLRLGVVETTETGEGTRFVGDDLELLRVLGAARRAGLSADLLPVDILARYADTVSALVRVELELFRLRVVPSANDELVELTEAATELSERLVILLRRKMLLPTLAGIVERERDERKQRRGKPRRHPRPRRRA